VNENIKDKQSWLNWTQFLHMAILYNDCTCIKEHQWNIFKPFQENKANKQGINTCFVPRRPWLYTILRQGSSDNRNVLKLLQRLSNGTKFVVMCRELLQLIICCLKAS